MGKKPKLQKANKVSKKDMKKVAKSDKHLVNVVLLTERERKAMNKKRVVVDPRFNAKPSSGVNHAKDVKAISRLRPVKQSHNVGGGSTVVTKRRVGWNERYITRVGATKGLDRSFYTTKAQIGQLGRVEEYVVKNVLWKGKFGNREPRGKTPAEKMSKRRSKFTTAQIEGAMYSEILRRRKAGIRILGEAELKEKQIGGKYVLSRQGVKRFGKYKHQGMAGLFDPKTKQPWGYDKKTGLFDFAQVSQLMAIASARHAEYMRQWRRDNGMIKGRHVSPFKGTYNGQRITSNKEKIREFLGIINSKLSTSMRVKMNMALIAAQNEIMKKLEEAKGWNNLTGNAYTGIMSMVTLALGRSGDDVKVNKSQMPGVRRKRGTRGKLSKGTHKKVYRTTTSTKTEKEAYYIDFKGHKLKRYRDVTKKVKTRQLVNKYDDSYTGRRYDNPSEYFHISEERAAQFMRTNKKYSYDDAMQMLGMEHSAMGKLDLKKGTALKFVLVSGAEYVTQLSSYGGANIMEYARDIAPKIIAEKMSKFLKSK